MLFVGESTRRVLCGGTSLSASVLHFIGLLYFLASSSPFFAWLGFLSKRFILFVLTMTMMGVNSSHPRAIAISYVYFLFSGLSSCRHYTCSSFSLTYSKSAHHTSSRFSQNRHIHHGHQRHTTKSLFSPKLLDDTNCNQIDASKKKWNFALADQTTVEKDDTIRHILVCGDGDLSYSAEIASELDALGIELYATVLEDEATHNKGTLAT